MAPLPYDIYPIWSTLFVGVIQNASWRRRFNPDSTHLSPHNHRSHPPPLPHYKPLYNPSLIRLQLGGVPALVKLLSSDDREVLRNACLALTCCAKHPEALPQMYGRIPLPLTYTQFFRIVLMRSTGTP